MKRDVSQKRSMVYSKVIEDSFDILSKRLENSSRANKTAVFVLLSFTTYLFITTLSIKDMQLLFPYMGIDLPLLNINIPLSAFILVAPMLLSALYINMLLNLFEHQKIIKHYLYLTKKQKSANLHKKPIIPFMVDNGYLNPDASSVVFKLISNTLLYIFPFVTLDLIFWRFTDYQDIWLSSINFFFIVLSFLVLILTTYHLMKEKILKWYTPFISVVIMVVMIIYMVFYIGSLTGFIKTDFIKTQYLSLFPKISIASQEELPLLDIDKYVKYEKSLTYLTNDNIKLNRSSFPKFDLTGRNLQKIGLVGAFIPFTIFKNADLQHANFENANLYGADFSFSNMYASKLQGADLQESIFTETNFEKANFIDANLKNANFFYATLKNLSISRANLSGASFIDANLSNVNMRNVFLSKANFKNADFENVKFINCFGLDVKFDNTDVYSKCLFLNSQNDSKDLSFKSWFNQIKSNTLNSKILRQNIIIFLNSLTNTNYQNDANQTLNNFRRYWDENSIRYKIRQDGD